MKNSVTVFLFCCFFGFSQDLQKHISTLKKELKTKPNLERVTQIYSDLTWDYIDVSLDSALVYGEKALVYAQKTKSHQY